MSKVLLVDDEDRFRTSLARRLQARGFDVVDVDSGEEAVKRVRLDPDSRTGAKHQRHLRHRHRRRRAGPFRHKDLHPNRPRAQHRPGSPTNPGSDNSRKYAVSFHGNRNRPGPTAMTR